MSVVLTPRVRTLLVCDRVQPSKLEASVFHLRGARSHFVAETFPVRRQLHLFVMLSSPRTGRFPSYVRILDEVTEQAVFYGQVDPAPVFPRDVDLLPLDLPIHVRFPRAGRYTLQLWFFQEDSTDVLKMEQPFDVLEQEA